MTKRSRDSAVPTRRLNRWSGRVLAGLVCLVLAACATPGSVESPGVSAGLPDLAVRAPIGLPSNLSLRMESSVTAALRAQNVAISANPQGESRYKLQAFCSAAPATTGSAFVCVWDVTNRLDLREQRLVTEENVPGGTEADPWVGVTPAVVDEVARSVAGRVATWLRSQGGAEGGGTGIGSAISRLTGLGGRQSVAVGGVTGAPGDGNAALLGAMREGLRAQGLVVSTTSSSTYVVAARVAVTPSGRNEQTVAIDWTVTDSQNRTLGTITQRNRVARGALDRTWGSSATEAANAAAKGVRELLP
jgi:hypothetical protein